ILSTSWKNIFLISGEERRSFKSSLSNFRANSIILFLARLPSIISLGSFFRSWVRITSINMSSSNLFSVLIHAT
ncbi:MAG: hypothetical protein MRERV_81c007, partial [Mycoplasmataceae bacterium RV_VA103A]